MTNARLFCLPLLAMLASCGGNGGSETERKTAAGEVLGGTISDEMLPLDTVTSESPPLREKVDGSPAEGRSDRPAAAEAGSEADEEDAEPEPSPGATSAPEEASDEE